MFVHIESSNSNLSINLEGEINVRSLDIIIDKLNNFKVVSSLKRIYLDMSNVNFIKIGGALGLICLLSVLRNYRKYNINEIMINVPCDDVLDFMIYIQFFTQLDNKINLINCQEIIDIETRRKKKIEIAPTYTKKSLQEAHPIVLPIEMIPYNMSQTNFENSSQNFLNKIKSIFEELFHTPIFNFTEKDDHDFWLSNYELFSNIYEHSNSWGLVSIHAQPDKGTSICYYDVGQGFIGSLNNSANITELFNNSYDAMIWALKDNHSSKIDDEGGHGLTILQNFIRSKNGFLEIRSGESLLQINKKKQKNKLVPWFPGVQISYFIPTVEIK